MTRLQRSRWPATGGARSGGRQSASSSQTALTMPPAGTCGHRPLPRRVRRTGGFMPAGWPARQPGS